MKDYNYPANLYLRCNFSLNKLSFWIEAHTNQITDVLVLVFFKIQSTWSRYWEGQANKNLKNTLHKHLAFSHNYGVFWKESCSYLVLLVKETDDITSMLKRNLRCCKSYSIEIIIEDYKDRTNVLQSSNTSYQSPPIT